MSKKRKRSAKESAKAAPTAKKQQIDAPRAKKPAVPVEKPREPLDSSPFVENPVGPDRTREVKLYEQLASEDDVERLEAAEAIVTALFPPDQTIAEDILWRHLERKLFRGLASGRKAARLGFSIVLTEVLSQLFGEKNLAASTYTTITFKKAVTSLAAKTKPEGDLSGQEERDHRFGLLFGLQSFVRAKVLAQEDRWKTILDMLLKLASKKSWVQAECAWVIVEALSQLDESKASATIETLCEEGFALSAEGVGIWLVARQQFPAIPLPSKPWGSTRNPLDHLKLLANALRESSKAADDVEGQQTKQKGNWNPNLHFVWDIVLKQFILDAEAGKEGIETHFQNFWKITVDENLFSTSASRERKAWGFQLFQKMLRDAADHPALLRSIFSKNLTRSLINQLSRAERFLHLQADKAAKVLQQTAEASPQTVPVIVASLTGEHGVYNFDQVTKTKILDKILSFVNDATGEDVVASLFEIATAAKSEQEAEARRQSFGDTMLAMIRHVNFLESSETHAWLRTAALPRLAELAYCKPNIKPEVSARTRSMMQERLASAMGHVLSDPNGRLYPCEVLLELDPNGIEMDEEIVKAKDKALGTLRKLLKKSAKAPREKSLQALALLYSLAIFQLLNGEADALSILDELKLCYDKLVRGKEDEDVDSSEVIVGILLSLISKPSAFLRKAAHSVFGAFTPDVTPNALKLMVDVLDSSESLQGQQELFDQAPDAASGSEEEDDDDLDSDVEVVDANEAAEDEDADDDDDDDDDDDNEEEKLFDAALAKALGTHRADQDMDASASDSDADMTDSEMMELDDKLVEIFKQRQPGLAERKKKKQEQNDAKEHMVHFKSRVLDLLELYVRRETAKPQALDLLRSFLRLMRTTSNRRLADRVPGIIDKFARAAKKDAPEAVDATQLLVLLKALHAEAALDPSGTFVKAASSASLLVAGYLYRADAAKYAKKLANVYRDTQLAVLEGQVKIRPSLFVDWTNWCQSHGSNESV